MTLINSKPKAERKPSPGELLAASYNEMLNGFKRHYDLTGDLSAKEVIDRAEAALAANK